MPYETLIPGFRNGVANPLVLLGAVPSDTFNLSYFNHGDYLRAVEEKALDEIISKVLYPDDNTTAGKGVRLKQQYFFVSASLQRILARFLDTYNDLRQLAAREAVPYVEVPGCSKSYEDASARQAQMHSFGELDGHDTSTPIRWSVARTSGLSRG